MSKYFQVRLPKVFPSGSLEILSKQAAIRRIVVDEESREKDLLLEINRWETQLSSCVPNLQLKTVSIQALPDENNKRPLLASTIKKVNTAFANDDAKSQEATPTKTKPPSKKSDAAAAAAAPTLRSSSAPAGSIAKDPNTDRSGKSSSLLVSVEKPRLGIFRTTESHDDDEEQEEEETQQKKAKATAAVSTPQQRKSSGGVNCAKKHRPDDDGSDEDDSLVSVMALASASAKKNNASTLKPPAAGGAAASGSKSTTTTTQRKSSGVGSGGASEANVNCAKKHRPDDDGSDEDDSLPSETALASASAKKNNASTLKPPAAGGAAASGSKSTTTTTQRKSSGVGSGASEANVNSAKKHHRDDDECDEEDSPSKTARTSTSSVKNNKSPAANSKRPVAGGAAASGSKNNNNTSSSVASKPPAAGGAAASLTKATLIVEPQIDYMSDDDDSTFASGSSDDESEENEDEDVADDDGADDGAGELADDLLDIPDPTIEAAVVPAVRDRVEIRDVMPPLSSYRPAQIFNHHNNLCRQFASHIVWTVMTLGFFFFKWADILPAVREVLGTQLGNFISRRSALSTIGSKVKNALRDSARRGLRQYDYERLERNDMGPIVEDRLLIFRDDNNENGESTLFGNPSFLPAARRIHIDGTLSLGALALLTAHVLRKERLDEDQYFHYSRNDRDKQKIFSFRVFRRTVQDLVTEGRRLPAPFATCKATAMDVVDLIRNYATPLKTPGHEHLEQRNLDAKEAYMETFKRELRNRLEEANLLH